MNSDEAAAAGPRFALERSAMAVIPWMEGKEIGHWSAPIVAAGNAGTTQIRRAWPLGS